MKEKFTVTGMTCSACSAGIERTLNKMEGIVKAEVSLMGESMNVEYDETGSIGKRYRRQDEIGTPYCVTVDFDTLEDNAVTVRDRDTMQQVRMPISQLKAYLDEKLFF